MDKDIYDATLFGVVFHQQRVERKLSQSQLAEHGLARSQSWISSMENGLVKYEDISRHMPKLAAAIGFKLRDLEERCSDVDRMAEKIAKLAVIDEFLVKAPKKGPSGAWWEEVSSRLGKEGVLNVIRLATQLVAVKRRS